MKNIKEMYDFALKNGELFDVRMVGDELDIRSGSGIGVLISKRSAEIKVCQFRYYDTIKSNRVFTDTRFFFLEDLEDRLAGFIAAGPALVEFDCKKTMEVLVGFKSERTTDCITYSNKDLAITVRFMNGDNNFLVSLRLANFEYNDLDTEMGRHETGSPYLGVIWMQRKALSAYGKLEKKSAALISFVEMLRIHNDGIGRNRDKGIWPQIIIDDETSDVSTSIYEIRDRLATGDVARSVADQVKEKYLSYIKTTIRYLFSKYKTNSFDRERW
jgi:hypothetical protein